MIGIGQNGMILCGTGQEVYARYAESFYAQFDIGFLLLHIIY